MRPLEDKVVKRKRQPWSLHRLKFRHDYRRKLPESIARFTGYRPPNAKPPYEPLPFPPFSWVKKISLKHETWLFAFVGSLIGILLVEAIMSTNTAFRDAYHTPTIITSFGASAVLMFGVIESPVSQPRNVIFGHFLAALIATCITRLFVLNGAYQGYLDNAEFHSSTYINGALSMSISLLAMLMTGTAHPPAGATALNAAVQANIVSLSWRYIPTILASSLIMLTWALIVNNLGRRRYPLHWWSPESTFVQHHTEGEDDSLSDAEQGEVQRELDEEGDLALENDQDGPTDPALESVPANRRT
ncbi:hypothetical protein ANO11243_091670 [Dothideomycetidae sp. 11243]|nr:hypothetical protein ANO11243_091670 [fungal sp. No.11243]